MSFKKTNTQFYSKSRPPITPETQYWNKLGVPVLLKEFGTIDYVDFSPIEPHYFAVTCSVRVQLYNPITRSVAKNFNKFRENAYGGSFRSDGMLLVAGGEEGVLRLFDVNSKSLLRVFKGHTGAVHRTYFTSDKTHVASFSDDKTVATWDIPTEKQLQVFNGHNDYVRAGCPSPISANVLLSGSYDGKIRLFDDRKGNDPVFVFDHGAPIESVAYLPSGGIFLSAGGTEIKVWDSYCGSKVLTNINQHHKTVTCLRVSSDGSRFFSGSLDRHVKIYSVSNYQPVHTFDYPNAVLSLGLSSNDETLVVGMVDGLISVRRRETESPVEKPINKNISSRFVGDHFRLSNVVEVPLDKSACNEKIYDKCLRKFQYSKALNEVLREPYPPKITVSVMHELIRRKGLHQAVAGTPKLERLLQFIFKYIGDYRFTRILSDVAAVVLDVYGGQILTLPPKITLLLRKLQRRVSEEYELTMKLATLQGALQMMLAASNSSVNTITQTTAENAIEPSSAAQENFVINVG